MITFRPVESRTKKMGSQVYEELDNAGVSIR